MVFTFQCQPSKFQLLTQQQCEPTNTTTKILQRWSTTPNRKNSTNNSGAADKNVDPEDFVIRSFVRPHDKSEKKGDWAKQQ